MKPLTPEWAVPPAVHAFSTTRVGGVSVGPYRSLNLADHVGDAPTAVSANRRRLSRELGVPAEPLWLNQVHGRNVHVLEAAVGARPDADAAVGVAESIHLAFLKHVRVSSGSMTDR